MDENSPEPANLTLLRRLVTVLTVVMISGVIIVVGLLVTRLRSAPPTLPTSIELPGDAKAVAFTQAADWFAVVTDDDRILIFDRLSGALRQEVNVE